MIWKSVPYILLGWILCLGSSNTQAQSKVPGYRGKKLSVFVMMGSGIGMNAPTYKYPQKDIFLKFIPHASLDYVVSRRTSLGLNYKRYQVGTLLNSTETAIKEIHGGIQCHSFGIHMKAYTFLNRGNIAPLGMYWKFQFDQLIYSLIDLEGKFFNDGHTKVGTFNTSAAYLGVGGNFLIRDVVYLTGEAQYGYVFAPFFSNSEVLRLNKGQTQRRLSRFNSVMLNVGVGFLII